MADILQTAEGKRLVEDRDKKQYWKRWGSYLSDRQWGTVREDYSGDGTAWEYFPHDQARSRAYRWGEDGIAGISDNHQNICFAIALWNEQDSILKERLFGLSGNQGNHGEDVKEYYFYTDNTPTHSYMNCLYKYPQQAFPYNSLDEVNERRRKGEDRNPFEFELMDTGIFNDDRYFDISVEYAKNSPEDIAIRITVTNRSQDEAKLHLLPTIWFRNTWSWGYPDQKKEDKSLRTFKSDADLGIIEGSCKDGNLGKRWLYCKAPKELLYTENETNREELGWGDNSSYVKDGINDYILSGGKEETVNRDEVGTKASAHYELIVPPGATEIVRLRLSDIENIDSPFGNDFDTIFRQRKQEADEFYQAVCPHPISDEMRSVQRQAFAGMLWCKQFYHYVVHDWLNGDPNQPQPPESRKGGRNKEWTHLFNEDIISMPDTWEYPWFAAWDLAFHTIPFALIDPDFAKKQLYLFTREWYMHPNGQIPAYEWKFSDVNPPVQAWAAWRVYKIEQKMYGNADRAFLEEIFQKLTTYFTWWVNRKDFEGNNLFEGGFLGLDNISIFDRSNLNIPGNAIIEQSDGTSWMGMYCLNMLKIASELAKEDETSMYEDIASKFFQHFLLIADAMNKLGGDEVDIWDKVDNFYYDILKVPANALPNGNDAFAFSMKVRSIVGLIPLFAVETLDKETVDKYLSSDFKPRMDWFINNRKQLTENNENIAIEQDGGLFLSLVSRTRLKQILKRMLDENEFLSPYGIRSLSKVHQQTYQLPFPIKSDKGNGTYEYIQPTIQYEPAESSVLMFGGNSNWRGPVWFPINFLIIESLQKFHYYLKDEVKVLCPTESGDLKEMNLWEVSMELSHRLIKTFLKGSSVINKTKTDWRPVYGDTEKFQTDENWRNLILFYEYFHGDNGSGLGASHQTGWTGLIAKLIQQWGEYPAQKKLPDSK